jgi:hypothetical protein
VNQNSPEYVSVVGYHLIQPLLDLVEKLESLPAAEPNEVLTVPPENGYSCAVILFTTILLASVLIRTRYVRDDASDTHVADFFRKISPNQDLAHDVNEIFAIRDAIVHNHLWKGEIDPVTMKFTSPPELLPGYGEGKRFEAVMDPKTRLSRRLKLNLLPPRISRRDAYIVFKTAVRALEQLEKMDRRYVRLARLPEVLNALTSLEQSSATS